MDPITILLVGAAVIVLAWPLLRGRAGAAPRLRPAEVKERLDRGEALILLDVRTPGERAGGGIAGSVAAPLSELARHVPALRERAAGGEEPGVVVVCRSGARAARALPILSAAGFRKVAVLDGGLAGWTRAGLPLDRGSP